MTPYAVVDTNVVIDALANRQPWAASAQRLLRMAARGEARLCLTGSAVTDLYYLLNKWAYHDRRKTLEAIRILLESLGVAPVGRAEIMLAASSDMPDFEDAVLAYAALRHHASYIVTRNAADFAQSPVPPIDVDGYLDLLESAR